MKFLQVSLFLLAAIGLTIIAAQAAPPGNLLAIRGPILCNYGEYSQLYVVFNHDTHKSVKCRTCHHMATEEGKRFVKCTTEACHSIKGSHNEDPMSAFMAYHASGMDRSCYGCHTLKRASHPDFRGCQPCHMSPATRDRITKAEK